MGMNPGDRQSPNWLALWWGRRFEYRQQIELAVIDMCDRYGAAAYGIARNSARARGGAEHRRVVGLGGRRLRAEAIGHVRGLVGGPPGWAARRTARRGPAPGGWRRTSSLRGDSLAV